MFCTMEPKNKINSGGCSLRCCGFDPFLFRVHQSFRRTSATTAGKVILWNTCVQTDKTCCVMSRNPAILFLFDHVHWLCKERQQPQHIPFLWVIQTFHRRWAIPSPCLISWAYRLRVCCGVPSFDGSVMNQCVWPVKKIEQCHLLKLKSIQTEDDIKYKSGLGGKNMTMNNLDFTYGCKNTRKFVFFFQILGLVDMVSKKHVAPKKTQT